MSSRYIRQYVRFSSPRQFWINLWNMVGALHNPKGMQLHSKKPKLDTVNAVYCFNNLSILICQNLDFRSRHKKWPVLTKLSSASWILGNGYESFFVWALRGQKSMQKWRLPSYFWSSTTVLCLNLTSLTGMFRLLPPVVGKSILITL